jgi:thymidylate synthase (FAD)
MINNQNKHFVLPKVYFIGATALDITALTSYLKDTDQFEFLQEIEYARKQGLSDGEIICSFYAKLCYSSLSLKKNKNLTKIRGIYENILGTIDSGHGSVFAHTQLNFVVTNCSRIFTHEQVRHGIGTAYSQTSGRYVRSDSLDIVIDPILEPAYDLVEEARQYLESWYKKVESRFDLDNQKSFDKKKKITSAIRRLMPNGQSNELGFSLNLRALRHILELRTSRHAEWEIRYIYNEIFQLVKSKYPAIFSDFKAETVDGLLEISFSNKKI